MGHCGEVVTLLVPHELLYDVLESDDHLFSSIIIYRERPFMELLLFLINENILLINFFSSLNDIIGSLVALASVDTRIDEIYVLLITDGEDAAILVGAPFNAIDNLILELVGS